MVGYIWIYTVIGGGGLRAGGDSTTSTEGAGGRRGREGRWESERKGRRARPRGVGCIGARLVCRGKDPTDVRGISNSRWEGVGLPFVGECIYVTEPRAVHLWLPPHLTLRRPSRRCWCCKCQAVEA